MRQRRLVREALGRTGDREAFERLSRLADVRYDEVLQRVAYGTPEAVVEHLQEYREVFGLTGVSLDMNPGGQIPYECVVNSMRLLAEQVIPHFK